MPSLRRAAALLFFIVAAASCGLLPKNRPGRASSPRVVLIGIDGADLRIIDRLISTGRLPTFARLEREGAYGQLRSQQPLISPVVWTTIATGRRPEDHGVLDFLEVGPEGPLPITSDRRRVPALWNIAGQFGRSSGFVGWYASYPAERVEGFEISDRLGFHQVKSARGETGTTFPESLASQLAREFGSPIPNPTAVRERFASLGPSVALGPDATKRLEDLARIYATSEYYRRILPVLQRRYRPDLLGVYFEGIDACGHLFMEDAPPRRPEVSDADFRAFSDTVDRYYEYQDEVLADLLKLEGPDTVTLIVSDHGFASGDARPKTSGRADTGQAALWHRLDGVLFLHGRGARAGRIPGRTSIYDLAPTVLAVLEIPISRQLVGTPLTGAFTAGRLRSSLPRVDAYAPRPKPAASAGRSADPEAVRKLAALGYLSSNPGTIAHDPDGRTASSYFNEGLSRADAGDFRGALRAYARVLELDPRNAKALLAAAALEIQDRELDRAAGLLERARTIEPDNYWTHLESASLDLQTGRMSEAQAELESAESLESRLPSLYLVKARFWKASGRADRALSSLEDAERLAEGDRTLGEILILRAQVETELGHWDAANRSLERAQSLAPPAALAAARGELAFARRDAGSAEAFFRRALEANPDSSTLERKLGETLSAIGRDEEGHAAFERAIAKARTSEEKEGAFGDLSLLYQRRGRSGENLKALTRAVREVPGSSALWAMLGAAYGRVENYEGAIAAYDRSVSIRPTALTCKTLAALVFETRHDSPRAIALWRQSLSLDPSQADVRRFLRVYGGSR